MDDSAANSAAAETSIENSAVTEFTSTENASKSEQDVPIPSKETISLRLPLIDGEVAVRSLYAVLDDKNRAIATLKRQLTNQQLQLSYYLHKNLSAEAVLEFSNQCLPHLVEDNMQLSLAMYKFVRDTGGKSRLQHLRDRLNEYDKRVRKALIRQEQLIRNSVSVLTDQHPNDLDGVGNEKLVEKIEGTESDEEDELRFTQQAFHVAQLELCSRLMSTTLQVRTELEQFRLCAERIVSLEDERNALVSRVYSLPPEQRYRALVSLELERPKMCTIFQTCCKPLPTTSSRTSETSRETETSHKTETTDTQPMETSRMERTDVLDTYSAERTPPNSEVSQESSTYSTPTHEREDSSELAPFNSSETTQMPEVEASQMETPQLTESLDAIGNLPSKTDKEANDKEIGDMLRDMESEAMQLLLMSEDQKKKFAEDLEKARIENKELKEKLRLAEDAASDERVSFLQSKCDTIEKEIEDMRRSLEIEQREKDREMRRLEDELQDRVESETCLQEEVRNLQTAVEVLRSERDVLQTRLIDSENAILKNYSSRDRINRDISTETADISSSLSELNAMCELQEEQIKSLLFIMSKMGNGRFNYDEQPQQTNITSQSETEDNKVIDDSYDSGFGSPGSKQDCSCSVVYENSELIRTPEEELPLPQTEDINKPMLVSSLDDTTIKDEPKSESVSEPQINPIRSRRRSRSKPLLEEKRKPSRVATTSLLVEAYDKDGKSESMHAVLECTSPVDGLLELDNSSKLRLRLQCTSPTRYCEYGSSLFSGDESRPFSCGDHHVPKPASATTSNISQDTKACVANHLEKIRSDLEQSGPVCHKRSIFKNLNKIYSQLFGTTTSVDLNDR